jgi:hypothetical protein
LSRLILPHLPFAIAFRNSFGKARGGGAYNVHIAKND